MIPAIGTDIVAVPRIAELVHRSGARFLRRCYTERELDICGADPTRLAGRWAAKEAVLKVLADGIVDIPLTDIEVDRLDTGAPFLRLRGRAQEASQSRGLGDWAVSISHDAGIATAVAIALRAG